MELYAVLMVMYVGMTEPQAHIPAPIPYDECVELGTKLARFYDHTMAYNHPIIECTIVYDYIPPPPPDGGLYL